MILKRIHNFDQVMPFKEAVIQLNKEFDNIYHCLQIVFGIFNKLDEQSAKERVEKILSMNERYFK